MCGIAGYFVRANEDTPSLQAMVQSIAHRGPDGEGMWTSGNVGLGHRRLSIIDLSRDADQPMHSEDGKLHIIFNGEIYNYKDLRKRLIAQGRGFRTHSDTEVILHLYQVHGIQAFEYLRGMFAFALWDSERQELLLVRDRIGIKPLYYLQDERGIIYASELKAIAVARPALRFNRDAFWRFLRTATVQGPDTVFDGVRRLAPGTCITFSNQGSEVRRYWSLDHLFRMPVQPAGSDEDAIREFTGVLEESVRYHMVADVPVGAFLSGGLDSSTVVGLMRRVEPRAEIQTFAVVFPHDAGYYDESAFSTVVSRHLSTRHEAVDFTPSFLDDLDSLAWHCDEPFGILSSYAGYYLARRASANTKVVLTGDGGDELLAGYQGYATMPRPYPRVVRQGLWFLGEAAHMLGLVLPLLRDRLTTSWIKALRKSGNDGLWFTEHAAYAGALYYTALDEEYIAEAWKSWCTNPGAVYYDALQGDSALRRMLFSSMKARLVDEMLTKVDRMTMAHSLEARVPLLDHHVVEHCASLPDDLKLRKTEKGWSGKYILKKCAERLVPRDVIYREKHGFDIPFNEWLLGGLLQKVAEELLEGTLVREKIVRRERLSRILHEQMERKANHAQFIASLLIFERWHAVYSRRIKGFRLAF